MEVLGRWAFVMSEVPLHRLINVFVLFRAILKHFLESLDLSHHSRFTCECHKEEIDDDEISADMNRPVRLDRLGLVHHQANFLFYVLPADQRLIRVSSSPHGGVRPLHQKSTCLTQLSRGPYAVQIWSRNTTESGVNKTLVLHRAACVSPACKKSPPP